MLKPRGSLCVSAPALAALALFGANSSRLTQAQECVSASARSSLVATLRRVEPAQTPMEKGDALVAQRRYEEAIAAYSLSDQKTAAVWNRMGIAYQLMADTEEARRCYKQSLKLDANNALALNNLGTIAASIRQYDQAEHMVRRALQVDPQFATAYKNLGTILIAEHKLKQGQEAYEKAMALNPDVFFTANKPRIENAAPAQDRGAMNYSIAAECARTGSVGCALQYLRDSLDEGYANPSKVAADNRFASLAGDPEFQRLLAAQRSR